MYCPKKHLEAQIVNSQNLANAATNDIERAMQRQKEALAQLELWKKALSALDAGGFKQETV